MATNELKVPDIGDFKEVEVIEVLVKAGDDLAVEQSVITVESDKASMEIPSSMAGKIVEMKVKLGDKVSEGTVLAMVEAAGAAAAPASASSASANEIAKVSDTLPGAPAGGRAEAGGGEVSGASSRDPVPQPSTSAPASTSAPVASVGPAHVSPVDDALVVKPHASPAVRLFTRVAREIRV